MALVVRLDNSMKISLISLESTSVYFSFSNVKGPRMSSLASFRSDLTSWGSEFSYLCRLLSLQKSRLQKVPNRESRKVFNKFNVDDFTINPPSELTFEARENEDEWDMSE